ncbi:hypothetical protein [Spirosoma spitsbergense]|uniref:hypothetical protein n=1 Tax=Spirosoma spitsbergense TaxID=431554 RepID=UPI00037624F6|nr:hypothetical protein [Spirosoma spitsbergense]
MNLFTWLGIGSGTNQAQANDERSRAIAGEQITIDWHEADKQRILNWIAERKALADEKRPELSEGARYWFDQSEADEINRLEQSIQRNDSYIIHARNNILYHQHRQRR